jgi:hypothetical protein
VIKSDENPAAITEKAKNIVLNLLPAKSREAQVTYLTFIFLTLQTLTKLKTTWVFFSIPIYRFMNITTS